MGNDPAATAEALHLCACGCGTQVKKPSHRFIHGHRARIAGQEAKVTKPTCRVCGRQRTTAGTGQNLTSYDAESNTYLCRECWRVQLGPVEIRCRECAKVTVYDAKTAEQLAKGPRTSYRPEDGTYICKDCSPGTIEIRCRRCQKTSQRLRSEARKLRTYQEGKDGSTHLCRTCSAQDRIIKAQDAMLTTWYVVSEADPNEFRRREPLGRKKLPGPLPEGYRPMTRDDFPALKRLALQDHALNRVLTEEGRQRTEGGGPARQGAEKAKERHSDHAKRRGSILRIVNRKQRKGEFRLCPLCRKLIYLSPARLNDEALGFHGKCYQEWRQSDEYREWRTKVGDLRSPRARSRLIRFPRPMPAKTTGRPRTPDQLDKYFRWSLRHFFLGESWERIASGTPFKRATIQESVRTFVGLLPDTWREVFAGVKPGPHLDDLLPVNRLKFILSEHN